MRLFLTVAVLIGTLAPVAHAAPHHEHAAPATGDRPAREAALLKAIPIREQLRSDLKQAWRQRVQARREARQEARAAARKAAAASAAPSATPTQAPAPSYSGGTLRISAEQAAAYMRAAGFPESEVAWFNSGIIQRESGYCPTAVYSGHCGDVSLFVAGGPACSLFQLFPCPGPQVADPAVAARYAYAKWQGQGRSAWGG